MKTVLKKILFILIALLPTIICGQSFVEETTYKFNSTRKEYVFSQIKVKELNKSGHLVKEINFSNGFINGQELQFDKLFTSITYFKFKTAGDTLFSFESNDSINWRLLIVTIFKTDTTRILDVNIDNTILEDSIIIKQNNMTVKILKKSNFDNNNYGATYMEYDFKKHLSNYNVSSSEDVFRYNNIRKTDTEDCTYKYKNNNLIEIIIFDSPNIVYSKTTIKKLKTFSYNKTLKKANILYLQEKNSR